MMEKKVAAQQFLSDFWAELAVFGYAEMWADFQSFQNFDHGFWMIQKLDFFGKMLKNPIIQWRFLGALWIWPATKWLN